MRTNYVQFTHVKQGPLKNFNQIFSLTYVTNSAYRKNTCSNKIISDEHETTVFWIK